MLLTELFHPSDKNASPAKQGRETYDRLKRAGAHKEYGEEMKDLWNAIHRLDSAEHAIDANRKVNGGSETKVEYARQLMYNEIEKLEDLIKSPTGAGGHNAGTRAKWAEKQKHDPISQKMQAARKQLNKDT